MRPRVPFQLITLIIILAGFALRAGFLSLTSHIPLHADEHVYYNLAEGIVADPAIGLRQDNYNNRAPFFPLLLAAVRLTLGPEPYLAKWILVFFSTAAVALSYVLARGLFGHRSGLVAAVLLAFYPEFVVYSTLLLTETPFITFNLAAFLFLVHYAAQPHPTTLLLAAILWTLTILTRDQALYFTPFISLWLAWHHSGNLARRILPASLFLAVVLLGLSPWVARNLWATGRFAFVTQREGVELYKRSGNHDPQLDWNTWCAQYKALAPDRGAQQRLALRSALEYILQNPVQWLGNKTVRFFNRLSSVHLEAFRRIQLGKYGEVLPQYLEPMVLITSLSFLVLYLGWVLGIFFAPASPVRNLLFLWLGYSTAVSIVITLLFRTRSLMLAILALFAGYFWSQPVAALHRLRTRPSIAFLAIAFLALLLTNISVDPHLSRPATELVRNCILPRDVIEY